MDKIKLDKGTVVGGIVAAAMFAVVIGIAFKYNTDNSKQTMARTVENSFELQLVLEENYREYENIRTYTFDVRDIANRPCKLSDGVIKIEYIERTLNEFLDSNKFDTKSIGFIGNKFYIQQDMNSPIENKDIELYILSLSDKFTSDDWFGMTEAVLANADVLTDTVFSYTTDVGDRHYMYVCTK